MAEPFVNDPSYGLPFSYYLVPDYGAPLDVRCIIKTYASFEDPEFLSLHPYLGMIASVVQDPYPDNNGVYYAKNDQPTLRTDWVKLGTTFQWPLFPGTWDGTSIWTLTYNGPDNEPIWHQSTEAGFTFTAKDYYTITRNPSTEEENYNISNTPEVSTNNTTFQNIYPLNDENQTAEVVVVRDDPSVYHLMLDPLLQLVLHGGDAESAYQVSLEVVTPIIKTVQELEEEHLTSIGLRWLVDNRSSYITTSPSLAELHWFSTYMDAYERRNEIIGNDINLPQYNNVSEAGQYIDFYCYASYPDWYDSKIKSIRIKVIDSNISTNVAITDTRRTRTKINV